MENDIQIKNLNAELWKRNGSPAQILWID